jgi:hypothetical protein
MSDSDQCNTLFIIMILKWLTIEEENKGDYQNFGGEEMGAEEEDPYHNDE